MTSKEDKEQWVALILNRDGTALRITDKGKELRSEKLSGHDAFIDALAIFVLRAMEAAEGQ